MNGGSPCSVLPSLSSPTYPSTRPKPLKCGAEDRQLITGRHRLTAAHRLFFRRPGHEAAHRATAWSGCWRWTRLRITDGQVRQMKTNVKEEYNGMARGCAVRVNIFENRGAEFQTRHWQKQTFGKTLQFSPKSADAILERTHTQATKAVVNIKTDNNPF